MLTGTAEAYMGAAPAAVAVTALCHIASSWAYCSVIAVAGLGEGYISLRR